MATPEQEHERITAVYSGMSDGELERIAHSGDELTDVANEALKTEISRRGIDLSVTTPRDSEVDLSLSTNSTPGDEIAEFADPITLRKFRDLPEALFAKGSLESAGIKSYLLDENMVRMDWFISNSLGGIKLQVGREDVEAATEILNQPIPDNLDVAGVGNYEQPKCLRCQSLDVSYRERFRDMLAAGDASLWTCHACGSEWEESDAPDPSEHDRTTR